MTSAPRLAHAQGRSFDGIVAWFRARQWLPIAIVLSAWSLMPGIRRVFDWGAGGFASVNILSIVPLLALVPALITLTYGGKMRLVDRRLALCAWVWTGGFGFAFVVALANGGSPAAAAYSLAQFMLPMGFGLWVSTLNLRPDVLYERTATVLLWLSTPLCLYAAYQFVSPPPWDVSWMLHANITSIGFPYPFQLRPFSLLNGPGVFADFLDITIVFNLPRLVTGGTPLRYAQFALCLAALVLTMVRTGWLGVMVGIVTYIVLTPNRGRYLATLAAVGLIGGVVIFNASALLGDAAAGDSLASRFASLQNLNDDYSYVDRQRYLNELLGEAIASPLGQGIGVTGTAAKLGESGETVDFDNGFVARFTEMGYFGMLCYLLAVGGMIVLALGIWRRWAQKKLQKLTTIAAAVIAGQVMLFALDVSSDHHAALAGIAFWLSAGILCSRDRSAEA